MKKKVNIIKMEVNKARLRVFKVFGLSLFDQRWKGGRSKININLKN